MEHSVKLKMTIRTTAPSDEGRFPHSVRELSRSDKGRPPPSAAGFLRSKKTEGEILIFFSSTTSVSPSESEEREEKDGKNEVNPKV